MLNVDETSIPVDIVALIPPLAFAPTSAKTHALMVPFPENE